MGRRLAGFDVVVSADLLEAELRAAFKRERVAFVEQATASISWLIPDRPLSGEIERVLEAGYVRGADCWHLACALYLAVDPASLTFLTLDQTQRDVARKIGFLI